MSDKFAGKERKKERKNQKRRFASQQICLCAYKNKLFQKFAISLKIQFVQYIK